MRTIVRFFALAVLCAGQLFQQAIGADLTVTTQAIGGAISLSPAMAAYPENTEIRATVTPLEGFRLREILYVSLHPYNTTYERPASNPFRFNIRQHSQVYARFDQRIESTGAAEIWTSVIGDSQHTKAADGAYWLQNFQIENAASGGLLSFEAVAHPDSFIQLEIIGSPYGYQSIQLGPKGNGRDFALFEAPVPFTSGRITVSHTRGSPTGAPSALSIRNFSFDSTAQVHIAKKGKGSVSKTQSQSNGKTTVTLLATPEEGWKFIGWTGSVQSLDAELAFCLSRFENVVANFARSFVVGNTRWAFLPPDDVDVTVAPQDGSLALARLSTQSEVDVSCQVVATVLRTGEFEAFGGIVFDGVRPRNRLFFDGYYDDYSRDRPSNVTHAPATFITTAWCKAGLDWELTEVNSGTGLPDANAVLRVDAPPGFIEVSPSLPDYPIGSKVTLSVKPAYRDRFLGWRGDAYSNAFENVFPVSRDSVVQAVFTSEYEVGNGSVFQSSGTTEWSNLSTADSRRLRLPQLGPGEWSEIDLQVHAPLSIKLALTSADPTAYALSAWQGETQIASLTASAEGSPNTITLDPTLSGPLRVLAHSPQGASAPLELEVLGYFQKAVGDFHTTLFMRFIGGTVALSPNPSDDLYELGSVAKLVPTADTGFTFVGWSGLDLEANETNYTIRPDQAFTIAPLFSVDFGSPAMQLHPSTSEGWELYSGPDFRRKDTMTGDQTETLAFETRAPGVISFALTNIGSEYPTSLYSINVRTDGVETAHGNFGVTENPLDIEIPVPAGKHIITATIGISEEAKAADKGGTPLVKSFAFTPGYVIAELEPRARDFSVSPASRRNIYQPGASVTIKPYLMGDDQFLDWSGALAGSPSTVTIPSLNRHILTNPLISPVRKIGTAEVAISENAVGSFSGDSYSSSLAIDSVSGYTEIEFTVPKNTELSFVLSATDQTATVYVDDQLYFEGPVEFAQFGFPAKQQPFYVTILLHLEKSSISSAILSDIKVLNTFELFGDFGERTEYVTAIPLKDRYAIGEKVTIALTGEAPKDWTFYDLQTYLPNLGLFEWEPQEFVRSYQIEMVSDTLVSGIVGPKKLRASGDFVASQGLSVSTAPGAGKDGGAALNASFNHGQGEYFRIYAASGKHVTFWARIPEFQTWLISGGAELEDYVVVPGDGGWRQFSVPVPSGSKYVSFTCIADRFDTAEFVVSDIKVSSGYGVPFITSGSGRVTASPANGAPAAGSNVKLTATPDAGSAFLGWGASNSNSDPVSNFPASSSGMMFPAFSTAVASSSLVYQNFNFAITAGQPSLETYTVDGIQKEAIGFGLTTSDDEGLSLQVLGPARIRYTLLLGENAEITVSVKEGQSRRHVRSSVNVGIQYGEIFVPAGPGLVTFAYKRLGSGGRIQLQGIDVASGGKASFLQSQQGSLSVNPMKDFYALGEVVTITAEPHVNWAFEGWTGNVTGSERVLKHRVTDHFEVGATYVYHAEEKLGDLIWSTRQLSSAQSGSISKTTVFGPSILYLDGARIWIESLRIRLNGLLAEPIRTAGSDRRYLIIPSGEHVVSFQSTHATSGLSSASRLVPGYGVILLGDSDSARVTPKKASYQLGDSITIRPANQALPAGQRLLINGVPFDPSEPASFEIRDHLIIAVSLQNEIGVTGFYSQADDSRARQLNESASFGPAPSFLLYCDRGETRSLETSYREKGSLSFEVTGMLQEDEIEVWIDGRKAINASSDFSKTLFLPPGGAEVEWLFRKGINNHSQKPITLRRISFVEQATDDFDLWLSRKIPVHLYATSEQRGTTDDFDGDGFPNQQERRLGQNPARFDIPLQARGFEQHFAYPVDAVFTLPSSVSRSSIQILLRGESSPVWTAHALTELQYTSFASQDGRVEYRVPLHQLSPTGAALIRIAVVGSSL